MSQTINLSNTTPAAPANGVNVTFQNDNSNPPNISANIPSGQGGVANEVYKLLDPTLSANLNGGSGVTLFTPTVATMYRITALEAPNVTATGATLPSLTVGWTDIGGIARTAVILASTSTSASSTYVFGSLDIYTNGSTAVTITGASYAAGSGTALAYNLAVVAEVL